MAKLQSEIEANNDSNEALDAELDKLGRSCHLTQLILCWLFFVTSTIETILSLFQLFLMSRDFRQT